MTKHAIGWHPADIRAAVIKRGSTLPRVMTDAGLHPSGAVTVLRDPYFAGEQAIASFLGVPAHEIWPGRYDSDGITKQPRIRKQLIANLRGAACEKSDAA